MKDKRFRSKTLKIKALKRDNFACQKCGRIDKTRHIFEAHHIIPVYVGGRDELDNIITLCFDCHYFAPDDKEQFDKYMEEQTDGTLTALLKVWKKVREEHPELIEEVNKKKEK